MTLQSQRVIQSGANEQDSVDRQRLLEPTRTTSMGIPSATLVNDTHSAPKSETGLAVAVEDVLEGSEDDRAQDAARLVGEAQPDLLLRKQPIILVVEDTIEIAEVIQAALNRAQMKTVHEPHGGKALARYGEHTPDLILLDIGLPDISGWKFLEGLKERQKRQNEPMPPIVVITAFGDPANRLVGKFQGVHDYLIKPFSVAEVERVVTKALAIRHE